MVFTGPLPTLSSLALAATTRIVSDLTRPLGSSLCFNLTRGEVGVSAMAITNELSVKDRLRQMARAGLDQISHLRSDHFLSGENWENCRLQRTEMMQQTFYLRLASNLLLARQSEASNVSITKDTRTIISTLKTDASSC